MCSAYQRVLSCAARAWLLRAGQTTQTGKAVLQLQQHLPQAKILYSSAMVRTRAHAHACAVHHQGRPLALPAQHDVLTAVMTQGASVPSNMAYMVRLGSFGYSNLPEMLQRMHSALRLLHRLVCAMSIAWVRCRNSWYAPNRAEVSPVC